MTDQPPRRARTIPAQPLTWRRIAGRAARLAALGLLLTVISRLSREVVSGLIHWGTIGTALALIAVLAWLPSRYRRDWPRARAHLGLLIGGAAMWFTFAAGFIALDILVSRRPADRTPWQDVAGTAVLLGGVTLALASLLLLILQPRRRPVLAGHCPGCGYDLRGLPEPRCPECGRVLGAAPATRGDAPADIPRPAQHG